MRFFQEGDVVGLRSGGPSMTIEKLVDGGLLCTWFKANGDIDEAVFSFRLLELRTASEIFEAVNNNNA